MIKQIKDTARAGVTLVELLVVILIVAILAVTMLPMFKKYVVQAQYAAEPIPLVGHIRTQIGLYQYEHNSLPGGTVGCVFGFERATTSSGTAEAFTRIYYPIDSTSGAVGQKTDVCPTGNSPYLTDMDVSANELNGKRVSPDQVFYALVKNDAAYEYAIGVFGKKGANSLPENTGYAVLEAFFPEVLMSKKVSYTVTEKDEQGADISVTKDTGSDELGFKLVATWKNYSGDGADSSDANTSGQIKFGPGGAAGVCNFIAPSQLGVVKDTSGAVTGGPTDLNALKTILGNTLNGSQCGKWEYQAL